MTIGNQWPSQCLHQEAPKHYPMLSSHLKTSHGHWCAASLIYYSSLKSHLRSRLRKQVRCTETHNACSWHWSKDRAQFCWRLYHDDARPPPCTTSASKVEQTGPRSFASFTIFTSCLSKKNTSETQRMYKILSKSLTNWKAQNKTSFSLIAMCWLWWLKRYLWTQW